MSDVVEPDGSTSPTLRLETNGDGHNMVLALHGELDLATAPDVEFEWNGLVAVKPTSVTLDLDGLDFIDSSGIQLFVVMNNHAEEHGYPLALRNVPAQALRVFELTGALPYFTIVS